jgi:hypothetical protein
MLLSLTLDCGIHQGNINNFTKFVADGNWELGMGHWGWGMGHGGGSRVCGFPDLSGLPSLGMGIKYILLPLVFLIL